MCKKVEILLGYAKKTLSLHTKLHNMPDNESNIPYMRTDTVLSLPAEVRADAWAVDAACSGNPGPMEYKSVDLQTGYQVFHFGPIHGTNNIGEFLAIVHWLKYLWNDNRVIYSDSKIAMSWVNQRKCKTQINADKNSDFWTTLEAIQWAEKWLKENWIKHKILKRDTENRWEIPADFGRK